MPSSTHIFRVRLRPKISRDIEIESSKSLYDLAAAIVQAFDFDLDHAFGFFSKLGPLYLRLASALRAICRPGRATERPRVSSAPRWIKRFLSLAARCSSCLTTEMSGGSKSR